ncbi:phage terminase large subunit family protein [Desulfoluna spongiiphila]|uniref:phage terminase large subunit family protein n=1 Tax=Desulfoluna spongiiphila TaxID=419481 RepID=UPI0012537A0A|nr:phage terminase large subunit family protein [Desulfoluna spongiiphila]VVS95345.1 bacteriophage lambda gpa [Desulfoluna spongiiphila]
MQNVYTQAFKAGIKPAPYVDYVEWANEYRRLPKESSVEPGKYRTSRTPYVEEILRELSPQSPTQEVVAIKPTQMGFTEVANTFLFGIAHRYPGPAMMAMPTDDMAKKHSKKKIAPSIAAMPCLKGIIAENKSRDGGNTLLLKEFPGGSWTFTGSNSPASARSDSIKFLILDDYDGFVQEAGGEGAPGDLLKKRTDAFGSKRKIYINSTPTVKDVSHIEKEYEESSQGEFHLPCPHCEEFQFLEFGGKDSDFGIKFMRNEANEVTEVWYVCKHCQGRIEEHQKGKMMLQGVYVHRYPDRKKRGFKVNALYSPLGWLSWAQIMEEFVKAAHAMKKGNPLPMKVWVNTRKAETFEEAGDQPEWTELAARCEPYKIMTVPAGGMLVTAGVDTQDNRLAVVVRAWGKEEENWLVYHIELYGDPDLPEVWDQLDEILNYDFCHESGADLKIVSMSIDTGGHKDEAVKRYCRKRAAQGVVAIKGANTKNKPIVNPPSLQDVDYKGKKIERGVQLWPVGTDTAKGIIYSRLNNKIDPGKEAQPGYYHFPVGTSDEYFEQLTAEKLITKFNKGFPIKEWIKTRERNEAIDCEVYCYHAALRAGVNRIDFDRLKEQLQNRGNNPEPQQSKPRQRQVIRSKWMS